MPVKLKEKLTLSYYLGIQIILSYSKNNFLCFIFFNIKYLLLKT